ncbi:MAG: DUF4412 domain-containing protein [Bacteroidota bacterium]
MKKIFIFSFLILALSSFTEEKDFFVGKILYKFSFVDLEGNNITDKLAPYFGHEQHYFINNTNYKAYDENNSWTQLYNSESNSYYSFKKDKTAKRFDGALQTSTLSTVMKLDTKETIAGYECESIRIENDNSSTIYYFNPSIKTDSKKFEKHSFGSWNQYLEATNGALPLKFILTNKKNGYVWTSTAIEVSTLELKPADFTFPSDYLLKD